MIRSNLDKIKSELNKLQEDKKAVYERLIQYETKLSK